jgi:shikimate dehydrogenase
MTDKHAKPSTVVDRYAVVGNPIGHSKSPQIHAAFAKQTAQNISYEAILSPLDGFEKTIKDLIAQGFKGANVTVPFKFEASGICAFRSEEAKLAGAVNTLVFVKNQAYGNNTDGLGLIKDITQNFECTISGKRVLLLGAGGAAEGVFQPLLVEKPETLVVANRNVEKAKKLVNKSIDKALQGLASSFEDLKNLQFDVIINATSTGLSDTSLSIPDSIFAKNCLAYDMMYGRETPFMAQARANGAQVADGLGMLVEQAAEAFYLWRGVRPETAAVIKMLRS